ncbi:MAG: hypothetical protein J2P37_26460 [Ktedonobacteraceae bacterium]|nr:hypothetical protein [Ktedonobacteraceae bacterium]MBO0791925.1 hypothetical protein [Ktedonobacteraceae bacterium]
MQRQEMRLQLRSSLRRVTSLTRVRSCGLPLGGAMLVRSRNGIHHFAGMATCGYGWSCPVCSAKIRHHWASEARRAVVAALAQGMSALFVTRTVPHTAEDALGVTLDLLAEGRWYVANQKVVKDVRRAAGYVGGIAAKEITYGTSGWHPYTHDIEFFAGELSLADFAAVSTVHYEYLHQFYCRHGFGGLSRQHGVQIEQVRLDHHTPLLPLAMLLQKWVPHGRPVASRARILPSSPMERFGARQIRN